jgi:hypothetical protein
MGWTYDMLALVQTLMCHFGATERLERLETYLIERYIRDRK